MSGNNERTISYFSCGCPSPLKWQYWGGLDENCDRIIFINSDEYVSYQPNRKLKRVNLYKDVVKLETVLEFVKYFECAQCREKIYPHSENGKKIVAYMLSNWDDRSLRE